MKALSERPDLDLDQKLRQQAPSVHKKARGLNEEFLPRFMTAARSLLQSSTISTATLTQLDGLLSTHLRQQADEDGALDTGKLRLARPGAIRNFH